MVRPPRPNRGGAFEKWTVRLIVPALFIALFSAMFSVAGPRVDWRAWFDGPERGTWRAIMIGGLDVAAERMSIAVADGEIRGGRDGCNYWGYSGAPDPETGERMISSTMAACEETPALQAYDAIGHYRAELQLVSADRLEVSYRGVTGIFRRWTPELDEAERRADERAMDAARRAESKMPSPVYPAPDRNAPPPPAPPAAPPPPPPAPPNPDPFPTR
ncbi:hypothetical protein [Aurantiacibacter marinus]|uniref:Uncharacterized protein n=1 Tax=Aurantiacibacter marinus TaxID=874156 RepID=A0A0H0XRP9_9SPHN|nr:hypothetical protein [Aurantiacibacter marinus]KLI62940.1 hypothetical protein AAV99_12865 [Aurantiacibacter marinus]